MVDVCYDGNIPNAFRYAHKYVKKPFLTAIRRLRVSGGKSTSIKVAGKPRLKKGVNTCYFLKMK